MFSRAPIASVLSGLILAAATCLTAGASDSKAVFVNQVGFAPDARKIAIVETDSDTPLDWALYDETDSVVATGKTVPMGFSARAERSLHRIDFSDYQTEGQDYLLGVGTTISPDFDIKKGLYSEIAREAGRYFYHNRAGEPILADHVGERHARGAGHTNEIVTCFSGRDMWKTRWRGCDYELDVTGGWYDAGDHGKYVVNAGISTWTLLDAYEYFGTICADGCLNIPESGNGLSDILDEARDNIEWMLSMQVPQGEKVWVAIGQQAEGEPLETTRIDGGGLVHHKVTDEKWAGKVRPDENDSKRYLYPPSTGATLNLAAVAARCARVWAQLDPTFAGRCRTASERAAKALVPPSEPSLPDQEFGFPDYPIIYAYNNFDGGGPYGDHNLDDGFYWAQAELTASGIKGTALTKATDAIGPLAVPSFNNNWALGTLSHFEGPSRDRHKASLIRFADKLLLETDSEPLHIPFSSDVYDWGSNGALANRGMVLGHAYLATGERKYRDAVVDLMDYFLGRNPLGISYISGFGDRPFRNPHHRHWAQSVRGGAPLPPPGVLSGGPNNSNMSDPVAKTMVGTCAAQTCWRDDWDAWTQNEVTINWNAPLFWMSLFLDATEQWDGPTPQE